MAMDDTRLGRVVGWLARFAAIAGGTVLVLITCTTVISIVGRGLIFAGLKPIPGDYEIVEAGVFFAVFSFLPWCQYVRGHASVNIVTNFFSARANAVIELIGNLLMLGAAIFLAWRHWLGMLDKQRYMESTFILRVPLWWIYASGMFGAIIFIIVALYCVVRAGDEVRRPHVAPSATGGLH
jgi:TRAP-type C4-dicarboxylate transport system permease small subunit